MSKLSLGVLEVIDESVHFSKIKTPRGCPFIVLQLCPKSQPAFQRVFSVLGNLQEFLVGLWWVSETLLIPFFAYLIMHNLAIDYGPVWSIFNDESTLLTQLLPQQRLRHFTSTKTKVFTNYNLNLTNLVCDTDYYTNLVLSGREAWCLRLINSYSASGLCTVVRHGITFCPIAITHHSDQMYTKLI